MQRLSDTTQRARRRAEVFAVIPFQEARSAQFVVRPYQKTDRPAVRILYGIDEFARPELLRKNPYMSEYLADKSMQYYDSEPESTLVAQVQGQVVGALLGTVDTRRTEEYERQLRLYRIKRFLSGAYGLPVWLLPELLTDRANRHTIYPHVDLNQYPAHLHIGLLPEWRRQGIGTVLMASYAIYLRGRNVKGYHLYASSFHPLGMAFYRKLRLEELAQFEWRFHNGVKWLNVTETIFGQRIG